jgi:hypothetical protein
MIPDLSSDPPRDPALARALRQATADPAAARTDWARLHAAIDAGAARIIARRRLAWWDHAAGWARAAIPLAAAAAIALTLLVVRGGQTVPQAQPAPVLEQALAAGDNDRGMMTDDDADWLTQDGTPSEGER